MNPSHLELAMDDEDDHDIADDATFTGFLTSFLLVLNFRSFGQISYHFINMQGILIGWYK